jgi:hypothetical protein
MDYYKLHGQSSNNIFKYRFFVQKWSRIDTSTATTGQSHHVSSAGLSQLLLKGLLLPLPMYLAVSLHRNNWTTLFIFFIKKYLVSLLGPKFYHMSPPMSDEKKKSFQCVTFLQLFPEIVMRGLSYYPLSPPPSTCSISPRHSALFLFKTK